MQVRASAEQTAVWGDRSDNMSTLESAYASVSVQASSSRALWSTKMNKHTTKTHHRQQPQTRVTPTIITWTHTHSTSKDKPLYERSDTTYQP